MPITMSVSIRMVGMARGEGAVYLVKFKNKLCTEVNVMHLETHGS